MKVNLKNISSFSIIGILVVLNLLLANLPLTNILGYEFSVVNAIYVFMAGGIVYLSNHSKNDSFSHSVRKIRIHSGLILFIPLLIISINQVLFGLCPFSSDIWFYFIITVPAYGIALSVAHYSSQFRFKYLLLFMFLAILILEPIIEIYFYPQVYFYNPIIGFFPGNIYDEYISIDNTLIFYRIMSVFIFSLFSLSVYWVKISTGKMRYLFVILPFTAYIVFLFLKPTLTFATNSSRMENALPVSITTENFEIRFTTDVSEKMRQNISRLHEYHYSDLKKKYNFANVKRIKSFVFGDRSTKKKYFGAGNADVSKPWMGSIFIDSDNYFSTLRHELIHSLLADYGATPFKIADGFNPSVIEGYAMAFENNYNDKTVHYLSWMARKAGYSFSVTELFSGFNFFSQNSAFSYIVSGSFIKYLSEKYEINKILKFYGDSDFIKYFGKNTEDLSMEYDNYLDSLDYSFSQTEANYYFGRKPLIKKICPRYTARNMAVAGELYRDGDYKGAAECYGEILNLTNSYGAVIGLSESFMMMNRLQDSIDLLNDNISKYDSTSYVQNLLFRLGDLQVRSGNFENALSTYNKLADLDPTEYYASLVNFRIELLQTSNSLCQEYMNGSEYDRYSILNSFYQSDIPIKFIPIAQRLSTALKENYKLFLTKFVNRLENENLESSRTSLELAKYSIDNSDYLLAKEFLNKALIYKEKPEHLEIIKQYVEMVDWLIENSDNM
ncbi:MAG: hypothetical protein KKA84_01225 [Bacteroidetes bacterium]|nr:hypothetical protein [Bacteroidota bacterium]